MKIDVLTLFPEMFSGPFSESLIGKARNKGLADIAVHNLRDYTADKHRKVDDKPFGGGAGMVIQAEPVYNALRSLTRTRKTSSRPFVIYLSPQGKKLTHRYALSLSRKKHLILLCGHYEGIDARALRWVDAEVSIGDYVLTGGELPAMVLVDSVVRLIPGVVKEWASIENDSFFGPMLDCSHYTRPAVFKGLKVPDVLMSGDHKKIEAWRKEDALKNTLNKRPDLLKKGKTTKNAGFSSVPKP